MNKWRAESEANHKTLLTRALEAAADVLLLLFWLFASLPITRDLERSMQRKELMIAAVMLMDVSVVSRVRLSHVLCCVVCVERCVVNQPL